MLGFFRSCELRTKSETKDLLDSIPELDLVVQFHFYYFDYQS